MHELLITYSYGLKKPNICLRGIRETLESSYGFKHVTLKALKDAGIYRIPIEEFNKLIEKLSPVDYVDDMEIDINDIVDTD